MNTQQFLEEFVAIANAPGGVQRLREMILQLAVQGKLVEQNHNNTQNLQELKTDEKSDNVDLFVKKEPIRNEEKYVVIPDEWKWMRLKWLGNLFNGNSINEKIKAEKYTGLKKGLDFIATKDVGYGFAPINYNNGVRIPIDEPKFKVAHKQSVLICAEGGSAGKKCGITDRDICFGNKLIAFESFGSIIPMFVLYLYLTPVFFKQFQNKMTGIIGGISISNFSEISVPLPPLEEQQRIVAKVDQLMSICDKLETQQNKRSELVGFTRKTALETLANAQSSAELQPAWKRVEENLGMLFETPEDIEDLKKCVLQNAVNGLFSINQCTESKVLKDVIVFGPRNGLSPQAVNYFTDKKVLTLSATTKGIIDISKFKHIDMDIESDSHLWLENGDVLIQRGNSKEYVGVSAVYIGPSKSYIYPDLMMKILVDTNMILVDYLHMCLLSPSSRQHMWDRITGTSSTMPKINKNTFETIPIPLPPLAEQHRIVSKAQSLLSLCDKLQSQLAKSRTIAEHLAQSIVESITGITTENQEKMKVPKTELVSKLVLVKKPKAKEHAPLSALLARHNNELSAKALWNHSGMAIDDFYRQLKTEMVNGWIDEPQKAEVRIIEE